jgi:hypothetical protein
MASEFDWYRSQAKLVDPSLNKHPFLSLFIDTLERVNPDWLEEMRQEHVLHDWALVKTAQTVELAERLVASGYTEEDADSQALSDMLPKTIDDELQYTDEEDQAAEEETAMEALDFFMRNPPPKD